MRTTLDIADDVLLAARERARFERRSCGAVISDLARHALTGPAEVPLNKPFYGFRPLPRRGVIVTNDLVNSIREEDGI